MRLTVYSRPGCHLCEEMMAVIASTLDASNPAVVIEVIDISKDAELEARYGQEIPVLLIDGWKVAKYRIGAAELLRAVVGRSHESGGTSC